MPFQEAVELSSQVTEINAKGLNLFAVVLEDLGIDEFKKYFKGSVYLDEQVS